MQSQRGSILVFVTLTVAVLMIVGVTFATATTVEYRAAMHHTHGTQAFYIAEAGLNWARRGLANGTIVLPAIGVNQEHVLYRSAAFGPLEGTQVLADIGEIELRVRRLTTTRVELTAQGRQAMSRRTVAIQADETAGAGVDAALARHQVVGAVSLDNNASVSGDISGSSFTLRNNSVITGAQIIGPPLVSFAPPTFSLPTGLTSRASVSVSGGSAVSLMPNSDYPTITVDNNGVLMVNVPDANDIVISVGTLTVSNNARINRTGTGTGRVLLHVRDTFTMDNGALANESGHVERFIVYCHGTNDVGLNNNARFTGTLVARTARVNLRNGVAFTGHIVTGSTASDAIKLDNNARMTGIAYAPRGEVELGNNARIDGVVIAGSLHLNNNAQVNRATGTVASFTPSVTALGLWATATVYSFHTWGSR